MTNDSDIRTLRPNGRADFIRWIQGRDGWFPEVLSGKYLGNTPQGLAVAVDGKTQYIDENIWAVYKK